MSLLRTRWAAVGAAVAVTLGGGGLVFVDAANDSGDRSVYTAIEPCRLLDTRPNKGIGGRTTPLGPGEIYELAAHGDHGRCTDIPADTNALGLNVTALFPTELTHLTFFTGTTVPNASSLNPAPGQPPTPNAVTTSLAKDGTFKVFNNSGSVHLIIDIVGIYQHHIHDDRYYTRTEADEQFVGARPLTVRLSPYELRPSERGSKWTFGWTHTSSGSDECLTGRVDLPVGLDVTDMSIVYTAPPPDPSVGVSLSARRIAAGPLTGSVLPPIIGTTVSAPSTNLESKELVLTPASPSTVVEGYDYTVAICTSDQFEVLGVEVSLTE